MVLSLLIGIVLVVIVIVLIATGLKVETDKGGKNVIKMFIYT